MPHRVTLADVADSTGKPQAELSSESVCEITKAWVHRFIIGQNICPFAAASMRQTNFVVCDATEDSEFLSALGREMDILFDDYTFDEAATTLFIMPTSAAGDWDYFMTHYYPLANSLITQKEYEGYVQCVPFHPLAEFSDIDQRTSTSRWACIQGISQSKTRHDYVGWETRR